MINNINLSAVSGDSKIGLFWDHVSLEQGITTIYSVVTYTKKTVGNVLGRMVFNYQNNPLTGSAELVDLEAGEEYLVSVAQYTSNWSFYESDTITVTGPYSSPNAPELRSDDIATINDLTSITLKTYFSDDYFDGGSVLTKMAFTVSSNTRIYNYIFDVTNDNIYTLTGLDGDKSYEINVCAINSVGISPESNTIVENTSGYPSAPRNFSIDTDYISETDTTKVTLYWSAPNNSDLTDLSGYIIKYKLSTDVNFTEVDISSDLSENMSYEFLNVFTTPRETYEFKIMSYNSLDIGLRNNHTELKNAYIFKTSLPVQNVTSVPGDSILFITWETPLDTRGYDIYDYSIKYYTGSVDDDNLVNTLNTSDTSITISDLVNGQEYSIVIAPQTENIVKDTIIYGEIFTITDVPYTSSGPVRGLSATPSDESIHLNWVAPLNTGGFLIDRYEISYSGEPTILTNDTSYSISVNNGEDIEFTVKAITININNSEELVGASSSITSRAYTNPSPITNLQVIPEDSSIRVAFSLSANSGGYDIIQYKISHKLNGADNNTYVSTLVSVDDLVSFGAETFGIILESLINGTSYDIKVEVISDTPFGNNNTSSAETTENHIPYRASTGVRNIVVTPYNEGLNIEWDEPLDNGGFSITEYDIYLNGVNHTTINASSHNLFIPNLTNGIYYLVSIIPVTYPAYISPSPLYGPEVMAPNSVKPYTTPDSVDSLNVDISDKSLYLYWNSPSNTGGNDIVNYEVVILSSDTDTELLRELVNSSTFDFTFNVNNVPSITNGTTYTLKCRAITQTDLSELLYSSYQSITGKPFGVPIEIEYSINSDTDTITALINNNGSHITGVLICAPLSSNATAIELANILVQNSSENPIVFTSDPLIDMFTITMNYDIVTKEQQPILIVTTNAAGMYYIENFSAIDQVI